MGLRFGGRKRQKNEKAESCVWGNSRAKYQVLEKLFCIYVFIFGFKKVFFIVFFNIVLTVKIVKISKILDIYIYIYIY